MCKQLHHGRMMKPLHHMMGHLNAPNRPSARLKIMLRVCNPGYSDTPMGYSIIVAKKGLASFTKGGTHDKSDLIHTTFAPAAQ